MTKFNPRNDALARAIAVALLGVVPGVALGAIPAVTQVFVDRDVSPNLINVVGTSFEPLTSVSLGGTALTVVSRSASLVTAQLPAIYAYGDYLLVVTNPGNRGGTATPSRSKAK